MERNLQQAVQLVQAGLLASSSSHLQSLYYFGNLSPHIPGLSDLSLMALVSDRTSLEQVRIAFLPLWSQTQSALNHPLAAATAATWQRHLDLNPIVAHHLARHSQRLWGSEMPVVRKLPPLTERAAFMADISMQASQALTAPLLSPTDAPLYQGWLHGVAHLLGLSPSRHTAPASLFAAIQARLATLVPQAEAAPDPAHLLAPPRPAEPPPLADAPPMLPELLAIYEKADRLIFVLPDQPPSWEKMDWLAVAETITGECAALQITTARQFRLAVSYHYPVHYVLRSYRHLWGQDVLANLPVTRRRLWQDAARLPSLLETVQLPQRYLAAADDELSAVIHDFQNKLLNVQLRHELLLRMKIAVKIAPPAPLPPRTDPPAQRIAGIFQHLNFWANLYFDLMQQQPS
ncbi:MAG: hypothetical protein Fur0021_19760 [Candidatus Promineifilaceae bacterium]